MIPNVGVGPRKLVLDDVAGSTFYVDSGATGASDNNSGLHKHAPLATIDAAIGKCTASSGDVILVAPGHAETVTAAITLDVAGVTIIGQGEGTARPQISCATDSIDEMTITAANCTVENLYFNESTGTTSRTSFINIAANHTTIRGCHFDCGAYDLEQITVASGSHVLIEDCVFMVTADGPDAAIELEGTNDNIIIRGCYFDGGSAANAWDAAAINSTTAVQALTIEDNTFRWVKTGEEYITLDAIAEPPVIRGNAYIDGATLASQLNGPRTFYVDSTVGNDAAGCGGSWDQPTASIDYAVGLCSASNGDVIYVAPGHAETLTNTTRITVDIAGVSIIGLGLGDNRPTLTFGTDTTADVLVSAANVLIKNIKFVSNVNDLGMFIDANEDHLTIEDCVFVTSSAKEAHCFIDLATTKDFLTVRNCEFYQPTDPDGSNAGDSTGCLYFVDSEQIHVEGCKFFGNFETAIFHNKTTAAKGVWIKDCVAKQELADATIFVQVANMSGGMLGSLMVNTPGTDVTEAEVSGTLSANFFINTDSGFGNDGGGGQLAVAVAGAAT